MFLASLFNGVPRVVDSEKYFEEGLMNLPAVIYQLIELPLITFVTHFFIPKSKRKQNLFEGK